MISELSKIANFRTEMWLHVLESGAWEVLDHEHQGAA